MSVGLGGAQADAIDDRSSRLAPVSPASASAMLTETRLTAALDTAGFDSSPLADAVVAAAQLASDHPEITELDLNPVIVSTGARSSSMRSSGWRPMQPVTVRFGGSTEPAGADRSGPADPQNDRVSPGIIIPLIVLPIVIVGVFIWYRRSIADMAPSETKPVSGQRLTAEALHRVPSPPWRVVYEIGGALGEVDHVVIGPPGVIAVTTVLADRPEPAALISERGEPMLLSEAAVSRGPLDELLRAVDASCEESARVFWGTPPRAPRW